MDSCPARFGFAAFLRPIILAEVRLGAIGGCSGIRRNRRLKHGRRPEVAAVKGAQDDGVSRVRRHRVARHREHEGGVDHEQPLVVILALLAASVGPTEVE